MDFIKNRISGKIENGQIIVWNKSILKQYEGQMIDVWIDKQRKNRTLSQNAYYWGVIVPLICEEWGEDKNTVHDYLKKRFLSYRKVIKTPKGEKMVELIGSTAKLNTSEFTDFNEKVKMWASQNLNCYIPDPCEL